MHRQVLRLSLRQRELLLPGQDPGRHPRDEPHHGPVYRLQVLPQEVIAEKRIAAAKAAAVFLDESVFRGYHMGIASRNLYFVFFRYIISS